MLYVILADIHGNLEAFEAVIDAFPGAKEKTLLCAGDIVGYGADPEECVDRITSLGAKSILGNHDSAVIGKTEDAYFNPHAKEAVRWTRDRLSRRAKDYLSGLPLVIENKLFTVVHGTLYEPEAFRYMMSAADAMHTFEILKTRICFVGHSHVAGAFMLKGGKIFYSHKNQIKLESGVNYIVNVGSVGQPRDNDSRACYCVYDSEKEEIELRRAEYDIKSAQDKIIQAGLPAVLAERLSHGR